MHGKPTPAMIAGGFADVQDGKPAVSRKILCIHVDKPFTHAWLGTGFRPPDTGRSFQSGVVELG